MERKEKIEWVIAYMPFIGVIRTLFQSNKQSDWILDEAHPYRLMFWTFIQLLGNLSLLTMWLFKFFNVLN